MSVIQKPKLTEREQAVEDALVAMHVTYDVHHLGERGETRSGDRPWKHDEWMFELVRRDGNPNFSKAIAAMRQTFRTGTGLRKFPQSYRRLGKPYTTNTLAWHDEQKLLQPVKPPIASLLHSMFMDASGATQTFEDWCSDFGSDSDSIKALETYRACQQIHNDLRKFFTHEQHELLEALLEGY
ncbi:hypothetical protein H4CHR_02918 [Variovorax sp. PBS-H4]|uniref:hypothetical protein n=1 Tax=Variovorax sp. PBS-H4 TaxID=434008 RepID=UPI00131908FE|nr:hypothetical protein [Variovorax sp. PBS-H4]VTU31984.1 hypothetical protein H4CHR_02918 [Variovorax sp. PBS-H4]